MATKDKKQARVLVDGAFGKCNDVVELTADEIKAGEKAGELDGSVEAVAYAKSVAPQAEEAASK